MSNVKMLTTTASRSVPGGPLVATRGGARCEVCGEALDLDLPMDMVSVLKALIAFVSDHSHLGLRRPGGI